MDANVVVKSSSGEVVGTFPTTLKAGATTATFRFEYPLGGNPIFYPDKPWTVNDIKYEIPPEEVRTYYYEGRSDKLRWGWIDLLGSHYDNPMTVTLMDYELFLDGEPVSTDEMVAWLRADNGRDVPVELTGTTLDMKSPAGKAFIKNAREAAEVFRLTNVERVKHGVEEFILDEKLDNVASLKSQDMAENNYYSHTSPTYGSPFEMMRFFDIIYRSAGENIAKGQRNAEQVVNAWMNSPGHRENILNPGFNKIGIGAYRDANGVFLWTQMFTN